MKPKFTAHLRHTLAICLAALSVIILTTCNGGGGNGGTPPPANSSYGWILVNNSIPSFLVDTSINLYGEAFSDSPTQYFSDNCPVGPDTSMTVSWANQSNNTNGYGYLGYLLAYGTFGQLLCQHRWSATVPLVVGTNNVTVTVSGNTASGSRSIAIIREQVTSPVWTHQLSSSGDESGNGIAVDAAGNAYVAGSTTGSLGGIPNTGSSDYFLTKHNMAGNTDWIRQAGTVSDDIAKGVAVGADGSIYLAGYTGGNLDGNSNLGGWDLFIVKYDSSGNRLWTRQAGSASSDIANGLAVDSMENIYVAGTTWHSTSTTITSYALILKYDASGNLLWSHQLSSSTATESGFGVAVDGTGNVYLTGTTRGSLDGNPNPGHEEVFLAKYDAFGNQLWILQDKIFNAIRSGVAIDTSDNVYITGSQDPLMTFGLGAIFVSKFNAQGNKLWSWSLLPSRGVSGDGYGGNSIALDTVSNVYAVGYYHGSDVAAYAGMDAYLVKLDGNGNKLWSSYQGNNFQNAAYGVSTDINGNVFVTGYTAGSLNGQISTGGRDAFLMKYMP